MKILALKPSYFFPRNGGEISLLENLNELKARGHKVLVEGFCTPQDQIQLESLLSQSFEAGLEDSRYELLGLKLRLHTDPLFLQHDMAAKGYFEGRIRKLIAERSPDKVLVHYTDYFAVAAALAWDPQRTQVRFTDNEYPRLDKLKDFPPLAKAFESIAKIQVASKFMAIEVAKDFPRAEVRRIPNWMPGLDEVNEKPSPSGEYFLFVNPVPVKGIDFLLQLAAELSTEQFLIVGNWSGEAPQNLPPNVRFLSPQSNLKTIFARAKALLMPSVWEEAFGRLPLEAMAARVPVITSDRGNLPETVRGGGQALALEIEKWKDAISKLSSERTDWEVRGLQRIRAYREECDQVWTRQFGGRTSKTKDLPGRDLLRVHAYQQEVQSSLDETIWEENLV